MENLRATESHFLSSPVTSEKQGRRKNCPGLGTEQGGQVMIHNSTKQANSQMHPNEATFWDASCLCGGEVIVDATLEWREHSLRNLRPIACVLGDSQMFVRFWKHMCQRRSLTNFAASHFTTVRLKPPLWLQGKVGCRCSAQSDEQPTAVWSVTYSWPQLKMWDGLGLFQTFWADFGGKPHITSPPAVLAQPLQRFSCCLRFACAWVPLWSRSPAHREWTLKGRGGQKRNWDHAQNDFNDRS